jgi:hypothetical protein
MINGTTQPVDAAQTIGTNHATLLDTAGAPEGVQTANGYLHVISDVPLPTD